MSGQRKCCISQGGRHARSCRYPSVYEASVCRQLSDTSVSVIDKFFVIDAEQMRVVKTIDFPKSPTNISGDLVANKFYVTMAGSPAVATLTETVTL